MTMSDSFLIVAQEESSIYELCFVGVMFCPKIKIEPLRNQTTKTDNKGEGQIKT